MSTKFDFNGKKVLVTGGSRGIGLAIAKNFLSSGAQVAVTARDLSSMETAEGLKALEWDISKVGQIAERLSETRDILGGLDIVVNNAGVLSLPKDDSNPNYDEDNWDYVLDINLKASFFLCQKAAEMMAELGSGVIVNIASDAGYMPSTNPYLVSKRGVVGFTKGLSKSFAKKNVRINAIAPGPVSTRMMGCEDGEIHEAQQLPLGRYSTPDEIADATLLIASDAARAIHGQTIVVNSAT